MKTVLITGGAGFIGSNLARSLNAKGYEVIAVDTLSEQIHGPYPQTSSLVHSLEGVARLVKGSVTDKAIMTDLLKSADVVVHFAAETGTGQSMYNVHHYSEVNIGGTTLLLDILASVPHTVKRIVVASSRSIYGEGRYRDSSGAFVYPSQRREADCEAGRFNPIDPRTGEDYELCPTDENSKIHPSSVYGITKQVQEQMVMTVAPLLGIEPVALRYQNVYGPGQSLSNPYTGILSIFANLIMQGREINVFEDGLESRDFVFIDDVVAATVLAIEHQNAAGDVFNVGSGCATTVLEVVDHLSRHIGAGAAFRVSGEFRLGDIRHNFADLSHISDRLGYQPQVPFAEGITRFAAWVAEEGPARDNYDQSLVELRNRGLMKGVSS
ncbi:MAG: epimerase [Citromicrobium sp.]|nr:epimerase [Citromicrobium sp.]|tara:strand:+ start:30411 stop:31556 length:1146 start_codon:yes stop_codon:yes gene_type:complete